MEIILEVIMEVILEVILEVIMEDEETIVMLMTPGNLEFQVRNAQWGQILLKNAF